MPGPHNNRGLFSDHYLKRHIPELSGDDLAQALTDQQALRDIYARGVPLAEGADEQVCEQRLLRPALQVLGFEMDPQPPLRTIESTFKPDYALFADDAALAEAVTAGRGEDGYFDLALAVGEAKRWNRDLGAPERDEDEAAKRQHPGAQIRRYLLDSSVRWGSLTNGRLWRIYERERSRAGFRYYEVDLPALLEAEVQDFRYFWLLFRRSAFVPDDTGASPIAQVLEGSRRYWLDITDRLRDRVYDALEQLMTGMIEGSPRLAENDMPAVHEASLIVLYRLLFCFYAEARNLLPTGNAVYRENHSVQTKLSEIATRHDTGGSAWSHSGRTLWQWFRDLSRIINEGDPHETGVPEYDGGLFDPAEWPLLDDPRVVVPDFHMAAAIDRVGRDWDVESKERAYLDYTELTVRELGSIYEGLLEMRPHWEDGSVVLLTDRGERKATGSYYTPEYIVDYIVTNTLDPLLTDAAAQVKGRLPEYEAQIARQQRAIDDRDLDHPESAKNLRKIDDLKLELLEPYFELMVLDPAMGSGHFLVAASEEITEAIITDPSHLPPADAADEDDENIYYKRRVVERCLYGVDLNPLAVELAKLSLWLHTVEFGKPLSFLKHHLREGNSLIGARLESLQRLPRVNGTPQPAGQANLFTQRLLPAARNMLTSFQRIEAIATDSLDDEKMKNDLYREIEVERERYRQVANVWLATYFGNDLPAMTYEALVNALDAPERFEELTDSTWFRSAQDIASEHSFFHWELEFPDAFFTEQGPKPEKDRGFDAVVANPPYIFITEMDEDTRQLYARLFDTFHYRYDLYGLFIELAIRELRPSGNLGFIIPHSLLNNNSFAHLRSLLLEATTVSQVVDFTGPVFRDASNEPMLLIARRLAPDDYPEEEMGFAWCAPAALVDGTCELQRVNRRIVEDLPAQPFATRLTEDFDGLIRRMLMISHSLGAVANASQGLRTGNNSRFLTDTPSDSRHRPAVGGDQIARYRIAWDGTHVLYDRELLDAPRDGTLWQAEEKLIVQEVRNVHLPTRIVAAYDNQQMIALNTTNAIVMRDPASLLDIRAVLAQLSGSLANRLFRVLFIDNHIASQYLEWLPIRIIDFEHPTEEGLKEEALARCREAVEAGDYETPLVLARAALAAHAAAHGPAGKAELREDQYWQGEVEWLEGGADGERQTAGGQGSPPLLTATTAGERRADRSVRATELTGLREDTVHDLLAWLAQRMIDLNKRKHEEKQGFLKWLERTLGCSIGDLAGRTIIEGYDDRGGVADFDALCGRLCTAANRRRMREDPRGRAVQERIAGEYEQSMEKLDAVNADLAATDALIDRIVYALYGLGPEEIAIIEGSDG